MYRVAKVKRERSSCRPLKLLVEAECERWGGHVPPLQNDSLIAGHRLKVKR